MTLSSERTMTSPTKSPGVPAASSSVSVASRPGATGPGRHAVACATLPAVTSPKCTWPGRSTNCVAARPDARSSDADAVDTTRSGPPSVAR
eukprot:142842-Chlamydomonas_euryale.AAC.1